MGNGFAYYRDLYRKHKYESVALDVETQRIDGPISVLSFYKKKSKDCAELVQFTQSKDLSVYSIGKELEGAKLILTFNGLSFDLPKVNQEYAGAIAAEIPVIDLFIFAQAVGFKGGLKDLEKVFGIKRNESSKTAVKRTHSLWREFKESNDEQALKQLLEYAAADVRNLYDLADTLCEWTDAKIALRRTGNVSNQASIDSLKNLILSTTT